MVNRVGSILGVSLNKRFEPIALWLRVKHELQLNVNVNYTSGVMQDSD